MLTKRQINHILEKGGNDALFSKLLETFEKHRANQIMHNVPLALLIISTWENNTGDTHRMRDALKEYLK